MIGTLLKIMIVIAFIFSIGTLVYLFKQMVMKN